MKIVTVEYLAVAPEAVVLYPDYLVCLLWREGSGVLEAGAWDWGQAVPVRFTAWGAEQGRVVWHCPPRQLRMLLARLGSRVGIPLYGGHVSFRAGLEQEPEPRPGRFSLFLSNESLSGFWLRLYYSCPATEAEPPAT